MRYRNLAPEVIYGCPNAESAGNDKHHREEKNQAMAKRLQECADHAVTAASSISNDCMSRNPSASCGHRRAETGGRQLKCPLIVAQGPRDALYSVGAFPDLC